MKHQQPTASDESTPAGGNPNRPAASPLEDNPTRLEYAFVLGILLIGITSCLMLYGRPIMAMLKILLGVVPGGN